MTRSISWLWTSDLNASMSLTTFFRGWRFPTASRYGRWRHRPSAANYLPASSSEIAAVHYRNARGARAGAVVDGGNLVFGNAIELDDLASSGFRDGDHVRGLSN